VAADAAGEPIFFNKRMIDFLGLDVADADKPGMTRLEAVITTVVHPDDAAQVRDAITHSLATGERFSMRYRLRRADGATAGCRAKRSRCTTRRGASSNGMASAMTLTIICGPKKRCGRANAGSRR
jgi:PAS domain-containing protein